MKNSHRVQGDILSMFVLEQTAEVFSNFNPHYQMQLKASH